jgi:hypothetical protein
LRGNACIEWTTEVALAYQPEPIETSAVQLPPALIELTERLAENAHDLWSMGRIAEGWTWGPERDDAAKQHPDLVPYAELSDSEREYDRTTAMETLKAVISLGYRIEPEGSAR